MIVIIILFVFGIFAMFSSFFSSAKTTKLITLLGILLAGASLFFPSDFNNSFPQFVYWNSMSVLISFIALILSFLIVLNTKIEKDTYDWPTIFSLLLFSLCGGILLLGANNLLTLFLGIEILSIPLYVLATGDKFNKISLEAGVKYFILGAFSSAFLLFGIALLYGTFGTFEYAKFLHLYTNAGVDLPGFFYLGMLFVLSSIFFKMSLFPLHVWTPDVYEGSHSIITAFMATVVKIAASISLFYLLSGLFKLEKPHWIGYVSLVVIFSILIGNIMGLVQKNVKKMMAYSSISHAGFIAAAILVAGVTKNPTYFIFYLIAYTLASLTIFLVSYYIDDVNNVYLEDFNGFSKKNPILSIGMLISLLSMAGIPLTAGFIAKFNVLKYIYDINIYIFVVAILGSALGMAYYLKVIHHIYFYNSSDASVKIESKTLLISVILCAVLSLIFGLFPSQSLEAMRILF